MFPVLTVMVLFPPHFANVLTVREFETVKVAAALVGANSRVENVMLPEIVEVAVNETVPPLCAKLPVEYVIPPEIVIVPLVDVKAQPLIVSVPLIVTAVVEPLPVNVPPLRIAFEEPTVIAILFCEIVPVYDEAISQRLTLNAESILQLTFPAELKYAVSEAPGIENPVVPPDATSDQFALNFQLVLVPPLQYRLAA